jgi:hypothetical protein
MSQSGKMRRSIDLEQAPNWKRAMHVVRVLELGIATLETGEPRLVSEHREQLLEIRAGAWSWERFERWRLQLHERFEVAFSSTDLPERPDYRKANDYLVRARRDEFRSAS